MALSHGPQVVTNGLVLALDASDLNSFKGEATTNVVSDAAAMGGWSPYSYGTDGTFATEFGTTGYKMVNRGSWNGIYKGITLPATGTYTISAWFRYWGGASDNNGATVYTSGGGISDVAATLDKSKVGVWQRVSMTYTYSTTSLTFYLISYGGTAGASNSTWDVTMPQIEQKSYATTFVNGTRGTTVATGGGWEDLTGRGNNGELVNGVRESSDNLDFLVFDGTNDCIVVNSNANILSKSDYTKIAWFYPTSFATSNNIVSGGNSGQHAFWLAAGNKLQAGHNGSWSTVVSNTTLSLNNWYCGAVTYSNTSGWVLYLNGIQEVTNANTTTFTGNQEILIGAYSTGANVFTGRISNVQVYDRVLTATEILQNFNAFRSRFNI
jgi:hypothetical protein